MRTALKLLAQHETRRHLSGSSRLALIALLAVLAFALCVMLFALCQSVQAQTPAKVYRVGRLTGGLPTDPFYKETFEAFRQGLRDFGWIEGQNILVEQRWTGIKQGKLHDLAADLVRVKVDVIVANGATMVRAAKEATTTIPIVMAATGADPVGRASSRALHGPAEMLRV